MAIREIIEAFSITDYLIIFALIIATYVFNFYYKYLTRPNPLNGPFPLPFIGNLHNMVYDLRLFYAKCRQNYGDICEVTFDGTRAIIISRPEYAEKMIQSCATRLPYNQGLEEYEFSNHGVAGNDDLKSWKCNKQFMDHVLVSPKFRDYTVNSMNKFFKELNGYWQFLGMQNVSNNKNDNNWTLETNLAEWFRAIANDTMSEIVTGECMSYAMASYYNMQSTVKHECPDALIKDGNKFVKALIYHLQGGMFFAMFGKFFRHYVPIIRDVANSYLKNRAYMYERLDHLIKTRREKIEKMPVGTEMESDMLTSLIILNTEKDNDKTKIKSIDGVSYEPMPDVEIRSILVEAMAVGSNSVKIDSVFSESSNLSYETLLKLKYCEAIIKETIRMIPASLYITRYTTKEYEVAGYKWPAGTFFHINLLGIQGHPEIWPNPESFDPDRFYNDNQNKINYSLVLFGGGIRICPARKLSMIQLLLWMTLVYRNYNVELVNIHKPLKITGLSSSSIPELEVRISPR
ncbi:23728_t:CDS:2, partial [Racocetra persica]